MKELILVIVFLSAIEVLSYLFARDMMRFKSLRYLLFPGIFFHECMHAIACVFMLAPIQDFSFGFREGHVIHGKSRIPLLGGMLISMAPLIGGMVALYFLTTWIFGREFVFSADQVLSLDWWRWESLVFMYAIINILATFAPSTQDLKNIWFGIVVFILISLLTPWLAAVNALLVPILGSMVVVLLVAVVISKIAVTIKR